MRRLSVPGLAALSTRERLLVVVGALVIACVVLDRLVLAPWWRHRARVAAEISRLQANLATREQLLGRAPEIARRVAAFRGLLRMARSPEDDMATLVREIEALGTASGVRLGPIAPQPVEETGEAVQRHTIDVQFAGRLEEAIRFLHAVESSKMLFHVDRASLALEQKDAETLKGTARLTSAAVRDDEVLPSVPTDEAS